MDIEGKHGVDERCGHDVKEPRPFFEPGVSPGLDHGGGFPGIEPLGDEYLLELRGQRRKLTIDCPGICGP
jgi:hypothetical protein